MSDWPDAVGVSADTIRATIFAGQAAKNTMDVLLVREDGRILSLTKIGKVWRASSGEFIGNGSKVDSQLVRTDSFGRPILPKTGVLRIFPGNNGAECTWQEAIVITLHFAGLGDNPPGLQWWHGEKSA